MQVEYDPRSESFRVWVSNENEYHFMRLIESPAFDPYMFLKQHQNSIYDKLVSEMGIDGKGNDNMNKNYIVVHDTDNSIGIIFKDKIWGVFKDNENGTAKLLVVDGYKVMTKDKYEGIIKQII